MEEIRDYERRLDMQKKIIEEERQRLLQEHAPKLVGFLPKVKFHLILMLSLIFHIDTSKPSYKGEQYMCIVHSLVKACVL